MSRAAVKDLGMLVDEGLYMTWHCVCSPESLFCQGCISKSVPAGHRRGFCSSTLLCETTAGVLHAALRNKPLNNVNLIVADSSVNLSVSVF